MEHVVTDIDELVAEAPGKPLLAAAASSRMTVLGSRGLEPVASFRTGADDGDPHDTTHHRRPGRIT